MREGNHTAMIQDAAQPTDRILSMLKSGDKAPADKLFFRSDCTTFRKGERVRVEEWKVWDPSASPALATTKIATGCRATRFCDDP